MVFAEHLVIAGREYIGDSEIALLVGDVIEVDVVVQAIVRAEVLVVLLYPVPEARVITGKAAACRRCAFARGKEQADCHDE